MKNMTALFSLIFLYILPCFGQDKESAATYDWFEAKYVKFKPGKATDARQLLHDYLYKANEISGRLVLTFESDMGDWDHIAYLHLKDGPKQLDYENAEIELKWWNAVVKLAGSEKKARQIIEEYNSCLLTEKHTLVRMRNMQDQMSRKE